MMTVTHRLCLFIPEDISTVTLVASITHRQLGTSVNTLAMNLDILNNDGIVDIILTNKASCSTEMKAIAIFETVLLQTIY